MIFSKSNTPTGYYVYLYLREDGTPYYVGKGFGDRAWVEHRDIKNKKGVWTPKDTSRILIVYHGLVELWALALERRLVRWYGRKDLDRTQEIDPRPMGILHNRTDGGDGASGAINSEETRKLKAEGSRRKTILYGKDNGMYGKTHTESAKEKIRNRPTKGRLLGKLNPRYGKPGTMTGKKHTEDARIKMSKPKSVPMRKVTCEGCGRLLPANTIGRHKKANHE